MKYKLLSENTIKGKNNHYNQPVLCMGKGTISCNNTSFGYNQSSLFYSTYQYLEARNLTASIDIQENTSFNNNACIIADQSNIHIGKNCLIGSNFQCFDSDFHPLNPAERHKNTYQCKNVKIGNNVFIGNNVTVLKGSVIGDNSVIGSNTVVTDIIPDNVIAAGNPAKIIKKL